MKLKGLSRSISLCGVLLSALFDTTIASADISDLVAYCPALSCNSPAVPATTFKISNINEFNQIRSMSGNGNYILCNDIDFGGAEITPVTFNGQYLSGELDGNCKKISNFRITQSHADADGNRISALFVGLFGTIKNLNVASAYVRDSGVDNPARHFSSVLVGMSKGLINDVSISGVVEGPGYVALAAAKLFDSGKIKSVLTSGQAITLVGSGGGVGGIVAWLRGGGGQPSPTIEDSSSEAHIINSVGSNASGGIVAVSSDASITSSIFRGRISAFGEIVSAGSGSIVMGLSRVGGIVGASDNTAVSNCQVSGAIIQGGQEVGGIAGTQDDDSSIQNCVVDHSHISGVGMRSATLTNRYIGGIVGSNRNLIDHVSVVETQVNGASQVGGIVGRQDRGTILRSSFQGQVAGSQIMTSGASSSQSLAIGGILGYGFGSLVDSYARGSVSGDEKVGGAVGEAAGVGSIIQNCYVAARVDSTNRIPANLRNDGPFFGKAQAGTVVNAAFFDRKQSGYKDSIDGEAQGKSTAQMTGSDLYIQAGWSTSIWQFGNHQYPELR